MSPNPSTCRVTPVEGLLATLIRPREIELAIEYYRLADEGAKADALDKRNAALKEEAEAQRKQTFKQEQDDPEKELGR